MTEIPSTSVLGDSLVKTLVNGHKLTKFPGTMLRRGQISHPAIPAAKTYYEELSGPENLLRVGPNDLRFAYSADLVRCTPFVSALAQRRS